jgi:hypothetical protein
MRFTALFLCILGLALPIHGQDAVKPAQTPIRIDTTPPTAALVFTSMDTGTTYKVSESAKDRVATVGSRVVAKNVQIQMGDNVLVADEAEIRYNPSGKFDDVELRGNVHLRAKLEVTPK